MRKCVLTIRMMNGWKNQYLAILMKLRLGCHSHLYCMFGTSDFHFLFHLTWLSIMMMKLNWIKKLLAPMYSICINWLLYHSELHFFIYSSEHYCYINTYSYFKLSVGYQSNLEFILKLICRTKFSWYFHERYDTPFNTPQSTFIYVSEYWGKSKPW